MAKTALSASARRMKARALWRKYRAIRERHPFCSPAGALQEARTRASAPELEFDTRGHARLRRRGYDVTVSYEVDDCGDVSYLGSFEPSLIGHGEGYRVNPDNVPGDWRQWRADSHGRICWYDPCNAPSEARKWYSKHGYARGEAWRLAQEQMRRDAALLAEYWEGKRALYVLDVRASRNGIELGRASLGGCDYESEAGLAQAVTEHGLIAEAINEAEAARARLCKCKG